MPIESGITDYEPLWTDANYSDKWGSKSACTTPELLNVISKLQLHGMRVKIGLLLEVG